MLVLEFGIMASLIMSEDSSQSLRMGMVWSSCFSLAIWERSIPLMAWKIALMSGGRLKQSATGYPCLSRVVGPP